MAVTSRPTAKKTSINFGNFGGRGSGGVLGKSQFASIGQTAGNNVKMLDDIIAVEDDVDELDIRVKNIAATTRVLGAQNRSFQESIVNIRERVGALESGQKAILEFQKDKAKIEEKIRKNEEARLKREGAESSLEEDGTKKDIEEKDPKTKKAAKGAMGILDRLKKFFTFVVAGWFTDKTFKLIEAFQTGNKEMINKIGLKLLAGTAAVAGIMSLALLGIGPVLGGIASLIGTLAGLLFNPVTLTALLIAVGIGGAIWGIKKLFNWGSTKAAGGEKFKAAEEKNKKELEDAGLQSRRLLGMQKWSVKSDKTITGWTDISYEDMNEEQKAAVDKFKAQRTRINDLRKAMRKEMEQVEKDQPRSGVSSGSLGVPIHSKADWKIINEKKAKIREKYESMINSAPSGSAVGDGSNVSSLQYNESTGKYELPETDEGKVSVVTNPVEETSIVQKGKKKGVEHLSSDNSDNLLTLNTQVQLGVVV